MSDTEAGRQADNFTPPVVDEIAVLTADTTSRSYDLLAVNFAGLKKERIIDGADNPYVYVTILAESDVWLAFDDNSSGTISTTAATSAGSTFAFVSQGCWKLPANVEWSRRINLKTHRYLYLRVTSGTSLVHVQASSQPTMHSRID
jgi:hypothetical protein